MKQKQSIKSTTTFLTRKPYRILLYLCVFLGCFLLSAANTELYAQEDFDDEEYIGVDKEDSRYLNVGRKSDQKSGEGVKTEVGIGGIPQLTVGMVRSNVETTDRWKTKRNDTEETESTDPPPPPTYPDAPVSRDLFYLLAAGLGYGILNLRKRHS